MTQYELFKPKDAISKYAEELTNDSWCLNIGSAFPILLHAKSNRTASTDKYKLEFDAWAHRNKIKVDTDDYSKFLNSLTDKVGSKLKKIVGKSFRPSPDEPFFIDKFGVTLANTYCEFKPPLPIMLAPPPILAEMLGRLFPLENERKLVLQYCASIFINPLKRPKWCLLLTGRGSTGKSTLIQMVKQALGGYHVNETATFTSALAPFAEEFPNNLLIGFEDKVPGRDTYTNLKQALDCDEMTVNVKHQQETVKRDVYARTIITSNHHRPFRTDINERRMYAPQYIEHRLTLQESQLFFKRFQEEFMSLPSTPAFLHHWFRSIDMTGFEYGSCPQTPTMTKMIELSDSVLTTLLNDYVDENTLLGEKPIFHEKQLLRFLDDKGIRRPSLDEIKSKLTEIGYEHKRSSEIKDEKGNSLCRPYQWQPITTKRCRSRTSEETTAIINAELESFRF